MGEEHIRDHCGVIGISREAGEVARPIYYGLRALQHRGQESAGIATFSSYVRCVKDMGLVHEIFSETKVAGLTGNHGIGHVRYSTIGGSKVENAQPVVASSGLGDLALAHNGDIVNAERIRSELQAKGWAFYTTTDSEILLRVLANELTENRDILRAVRDLVKSLTGAYSLAILLGEQVIGVRDPFGIRPLCLGQLPDGYVIASESVALDMVGAQFLRDVNPGEMVVLHGNQVSSHQLVSVRNKAHCMFEWVYFSRPDSVVDGQLVYEVRRKTGALLAQKHPAPADIVVPVPDSGRAHALGYGEASNLPVREGLIKNRYVGRTFIMPGEDERGINVRVKLNAIRQVVGGKRVALIDDSIVRGTTMRRIVHTLKDAGATEVHVRIGCAPIVGPCYLGIDMKTRDQFVARERTEEQIAKEIGADSVEYLAVDELVECIGKPQTDLCLGCLTEEYPVRIPGERERFQTRLVLDLGAGPDRQQAKQPPIPAHARPAERVGGGQERPVGLPP